jgi:hypothetical protein
MLADVGRRFRPAARRAAVAAGGFPATLIDSFSVAQTS